MSNYEDIKRVTFQDDRFLNIKNWRVRQLRGYIIWGTLIIENGSFKLKSIVNVSAEVDDIGWVEKFCFFFPEYIIFFLLIDCNLFFSITDTIDTGIKKTYEGFLALWEVESVLTYIYFLHRVYTCFLHINYTHRTVWVSTFSIATGKTQCIIRKITVERVTY